MTASFVACAAVGVAAVSTASALASPTAPAARCAVSVTKPLPSQPSFNFGTVRLAVNLPKNATFVAVSEGKPGGAWLQRDGSIRTKVDWLNARGSLRLSGRRLDRSALPLRGNVGVESWALGVGAFFPSILLFPSVGCWKITATAGEARLDVVVRVVRR